MQPSEKTFLILKPDCVAQGLEAECRRRLEAGGLTIEIFAPHAATKQQAEKHCEHLKTKSQAIFDRNVKFYLSGPVVLVIASGPAAISSAREIIGATDPSKADPQSIRGALSKDSIQRATEANRAVHNLIHASDSRDAARFEAKNWLGVEI